MDRKIIENFIYNIIYQVLILILPFITIPYISRIFSPEQIGSYSITYSVVQMFSILGMFAIGSYGSREIALYRDNKEKLSIKYNEIRFLQRIMIIISTVLYLLLYVLRSSSKIRYLYLLQSLNLVACFFDISWLYIGIENFKKTITRNLIVKIMSLIFILLIIKNETDLYKYVLIMAISNLLGNLSMWINKRELINNCKLNNYNFFENFKLSLSLLIPQIFFQLYTSFDRSILGLVTSTTEVGMFDQSQKIIRMSVGIVTALGIVMLPRISNMISKNTNKSEINTLLTKSLDLTLFISVGITFGIFSIADNFVPWFYGYAYLEVANLLKISSIVCLLTALGSFFSNQYAIPINNKKAYMYPLIIAGVISVILNLFLGRYFGALGSCITIVLVELIGLLLRMYYLKSDLKYKDLFKNCKLFIVSGVIMVLSINVIDLVLKLKPNAVTTIIEILFGGSVYCIVLICVNKEYHTLFSRLIIRRKKVVLSEDCCDRSKRNSI